MLLDYRYKNGDYEDDLGFSVYDGFAVVGSRNWETGENRCGFLSRQSSESYDLQNRLHH